MKENYLFLEYKFRDFADSELTAPAVAGVIASLEKLDSQRADQIRRLRLRFGISLAAFPGGDICPASNQAGEYLSKKIESALTYGPGIIWLDRLRFAGNWEAARGEIPGTHKSCKFCQGGDRSEIISRIARQVRTTIPPNIPIAYFAVPFTEKDFGNWVSLSGQDHYRLGNLFDYVSPMLYHRMIERPVAYIGEYVRYLRSLRIKAKILPIIQLKDMPDDLEDKLTIEEIEEEVRQALASPSVGVAVFSWDQAIEKNKLDGVVKILKAISK